MSRTRKPPITTSIKVILAVVDQHIIDHDREDQIEIVSKVNEALNKMLRDWGF